MYLMSKIFSWCSPDVYRTMSDWDKNVYLSMLSGEGNARKEDNKNSTGHNNKKGLKQKNK